jgi:8-oxo-dGTP diphosphatase
MRSTDVQNNPPNEQERMHPTRPVVGVGAVVFDAGRVLLVKRAHAPLKGEWSLPGGVVELGETLEVAVAREVLEETGVQVDVGPLVEVVDRIERGQDGRVEYHFVILDYLCRPHDNRLTCGSDAADVRWAGLPELRDLRVTETAIAVVRKALDLFRGTDQNGGNPSTPSD